MIGGANLDGADLRGARMIGDIRIRLNLNEADLGAADLAGASFRLVDWSNFNEEKTPSFRLAFGDYSVILPESVPWPCHWGRRDEGPLVDAQFFGRWRGWIEAIDLPKPLRPDLSAYASIPPPKGCAITMSGS
jgi:hypothetical protein